MSSCLQWDRLRWAGWLGHAANSYCAIAEWWFVPWWVGAPLLLVHVAALLGCAFLTSD